ncbi:MAG TPA: 50S ribosomal protein L28 [Candidatus Limnocylindria bacterium]|nr:50S ribosomal protein L28 [Candidatus Limnocylindria bacterium]
MARVCFVCDKGPRVDNLVSHANNRVKRWVYPNVQKVRFTLAGDASGKVVHSNVCTKCMKARKIQKVV